MMMSGIVELDLHGMNIHQAKVAIDAKLRRVGKSAYRLRLIHGYHGGTALSDMISREYRGRAGILRIERGLNRGETDLVLREF